MTQQAVIYARVSTEEQAKDDKHSLNAQKQLCKEFADRNGFVVVKIFEDPGKSASSLNRPALQEMLGYCASHKEVKAVLVQDTDRLARDVQGHLTIKASLRKVGVQVISISQPAIDDSAEGKMIDMMLATFNQFQLDITRRKTKKGLEQKAKEGGWPGIAPVGYKNITKSDGTKTIEVDKMMGPIVKKIFELYATGNYPVQELVELAYKEGLRGFRGNGVGHSRMAEILSNQVYYGEVKWGDIVAQGRHTPLINKELFDIVQTVKASRSQRGSRDIKHSFLLRGFVWCSKCGKKYTAEHHPKKHVSYYHCTKTTGCKDKYVECSELEKQAFAIIERLQFSDEFINKVVAKVKQKYEGMCNKESSKRQGLVNQLTALEHKRTVVEDKLFKGVISDEDYQRVAITIKADIAHVQSELNKLEKVHELYVHNLVKLLQFSRNFSSLYKQANLDQQRHYMGLIFHRITAANKTITEVQFTPLLESLINTNKVILLQPSQSKIREKVIIRGLLGERRDSNPRPPVPQTGALTSCATLTMKCSSC